MIVFSIRGTSGSGKTTAMRDVMAQLPGEWKPHYIEGRKRPLYYRNGRVVVVGHYEIDCGGCDTIGSAPKVFDMIRSIKEQGLVVLSEGLLWSEDVIWTLRLPAAKCVFLTTDVEECIERVIQRQAGREPADSERVRRKLTRRVDTIERARLRLVEAGLCVRRCSSEQAPGIVLKWIDEYLNPCR